MIRKPLATCTAIVLALGISTCGSRYRGAVYAGDLLSPVAAERLGLVESWHRQIGTIGGAASLVDVRVWVQHNKEREFVEVVQADKDGKPTKDGSIFRRIATDTKTSTNQDIGKAEADRLARIDVLKLERRGIAATTQPRQVKQVRLYMLGDDGGLGAYDAESGELLWSLRIGDPKLGYGELGVSDEHISIINGTTLYRIIADERQLSNSVASGGRPLPEVELVNLPIIGATNVNEWVVVPNTRGGMECHSYEPEPGQPRFEIFIGSALQKPVCFPNSPLIGWTTDRGYFYVMDTTGKPSTLFRLKSDGIASGGAAAASGERFFFASSGGRVYGIHASRLGEVIWNQSLGEPFYNVPYVTDNRVLVASSFGNLYCFDAKNGDQVWSAPAPGMDSVFADTGKYYVGRTAVGQLTILDPASGQSVSIGGSTFVDRVVTNPETDRIYLVSDGGTIQCLRPAASELPVFYRDVKSMDSTDEMVDAKPMMKDAKDPGNPFGATPPADPFGAAGTADPFGAAGGADPFGAADDDKMADPFGAADPFGN